MYADVALPVPIDQPFTYLLPETLRHRVRTGCRLIVPFGPRKLTGVIVNTHETRPAGPVKEALRLLDEEPVLEDHLISLGRWIAGYYCAPIGEVLRVMTPLGGEIRSTKMYSLTDAGRDAARQLLFGADTEDPTIQVLRLLERRSLSSTYLAKKVADAPKVLRSLLRKNFIELEDVQTDRDPLRSAAERLRVHSPGQWPEAKLKKAERELLSYLELHPGSHNLAEVDEAVKGASEAARALARRKILVLETEAPAMGAHPYKPPPTLNRHQEVAFHAIRSAVESKNFHAFLLEGVTGSGKTEVYLRSIAATLALGSKCAAPCAGNRIDSCCRGTVLSSVR